MMFLQVWNISQTILLIKYLLIRLLHTTFCFYILKLMSTSEFFFFKSDFVVNYFVGVKMCYIYNLHNKYKISINFIIKFNTNKNIKWNFIIIRISHKHIKLIKLLKLIYQLYIRITFLLKFFVIIYFLENILVS